MWQSGAKKNELNKSLFAADVDPGIGCGDDGADSGAMMVHTGNIAPINCWIQIARRCPLVHSGVPPAHTVYTLYVRATCAIHVCWVCRICKCASAEHICARHPNRERHQSTLGTKRQVVGWLDLIFQSNCRYVPFFEDGATDFGQR